MVNTCWRHQNKGTGHRLLRASWSLATAAQHIQDHPRPGSGTTVAQQRHPARHRCSPKLSGPLPGFPWAREPGGASPRAWGRRTSPTYVVILGGVARGGPEEVLGELVLREPIDLAAVGAACASPPPHPQVLTCRGKNLGFSWGRCSKEGGGVLGDTLRSISDGQMESTLSPS